MLDIHANNWRYNQLIAQQRAIIVERRDTLLRTPTALEELAERAPKRYQEILDDLTDVRVRRAAGLPVLFDACSPWDVGSDYPLGPIAAARSLG